MSGSGNYTVGGKTGYQTIQAALDQLWSDQGSTPFTATQTITIYPVETLSTYQDPSLTEPAYTKNNRFSGCTIPEGLQPTSTYRLVIKSGVPRTSAESERPVLYGKVGNTYEWCGIYVNGVDYVDILDLDIREFKSGTIFYNADYGRVISCSYYKNDFYGLQFFESDRCAVINTAMQASTICASLVASKEIVFIHNAFNTGIGAQRFCLSAEWYVEHHGPLDQSTPIYYAYNNTFHANSGGIPVLLSLDVIKTLGHLDGNVYSTLESRLADLYYTVEGIRKDSFVESMTEWRRITTSEGNSSFYRLNSTAVSSTAGLLYEDSDSIFNRGLALDVVKSNLPAWFVTEVLDDDADDNPRDDTGTPTPGPTEVTTGDDYDIFTDFLEATSDISVDDDKIYGVDRAVRQLELGVDKWLPTVNAGFFYCGDSAYYLYASKYARYLKDFTWSRVELPSNMEIKDVGILDTSECDDATPVAWFSRGKTVWANHGSAAISKPISESVRVYGKTQTWDSSEQAFHSTYVTEEFSIKDSPVDFFLFPVPQQGGPVVITDDTLLPDTSAADRTDRTILPLEYNYRWDDELQKARLVLQGATNLFENPHFHVSETSSGHGTIPSAWEFGSMHVVCGEQTNDDTVVGRYRTRIMVAESNQHAFRQHVVRHDHDKDLVISWYMRSDSTVPVVPVITTFYDDGNVFSEQELDVFNSSPEDTSDIHWSRYAVHCKADPDSVLKGYSLAHTLVGEADLRTVNNKTSSKVLFELRSQGGGTSEFDAFMAFEGDYVPRYAGLEYCDFITVEYDSSDTGIHIVDDLSISPILNPQHSGFLVIGPVPIKDLDTSVVEEVHTTLSDSYAPARLRCVPWSKIDGPNKLRPVAEDIFGLESYGLPREVGLQPTVPTARLIEVYPDPIQVSQGLRAAFHVRVTDSTGNPYAHKDVSVSSNDEDGYYVGWLGLKEMGSVSKVGASVSTKSDPSGSVDVTFAAADKLILAQAFGTSDLYPSSKVNTYYRPSITNHANPTLYRTQTYEEISTVGDVTSEVFTAAEDGNLLKRTLLRKPAFGTVELKVDGTSDLSIDLFETISPDVDDNEFHVDYATGVVSYKNIRSSNAQATYVPRLIWVDTSDPAALQFDQDLVNLITSDMIVQYDVRSSLLVEAGGLEHEVEIILMNPDA